MPHVEDQDGPRLPGTIPRFVDKAVVEEQALPLPPAARLAADTYPAIFRNIQRQVRRQLEVRQVRGEAEYAYFGASVEKNASGALPAQSGRSTACNAAMVTGMSDAFGSTRAPPFNRCSDNQLSVSIRCPHVAAGAFWSAVTYGFRLCLRVATTRRYSA